MINNLNASNDIWWVATDGVTTHYGKLTTGEVLSTLLEITTFDTEAEWLESLNNMGIEPQLGIPVVELPEAPIN